MNSLNEDFLEVNIAISQKKVYSAENKIAQLTKMTENEKRTKILRTNSVKKSPFLVPSHKNQSI